MKILGLITAALISTTAVAQAADVVMDVPAAPVVETVAFYDWTGFYVGAQGGYGWVNADTNTEFGNTDLDGGFLGGHVGYNAMLAPNFVLGVEGDMQKDWGDDTRSNGLGQGIALDAQWSASVRARLGYTMDRTMVYATGGYATTRIEARGFNNVTGDEVKNKETFHGYTVGAGVEHAFTENVLARVEYRYSDYGDKNFGVDGVNVDVDKHTVGVGLTYKF
ncbi:porin family protein [Rhizobium sp. CFBP 8762]|uniref:outer membrane protein n=1 Tax=Rhizobium sp. CFBP 8762 TaxID=2775279 RepID=UPI00178141E1|nr:outer membrane protein [Rhizobium sp. CFBP 8762]MBD8554143.1 porin family protein [Rhizobium sp. CFBP 8762]